MKTLKVVYGAEQVQKLYANQKLSQTELRENVKTYQFESIKEKNAFIKGMEEALGWNNYCIPATEIESFQF
ncbi:hypothetical protein GYB57_14100 [bacterium]|nr:hypothetical protein [bacterium]